MPDAGAETQQSADYVPTKKQIIDMYQRLTNELRTIQERVFDLQNKAEEHDLVAQQIKPLPGGRKCCRLISGVLVERTVAQVLPVVQDNAKELHEAVKKHQELLERKQKELVEFMSVYKIQVKGSGEDGLQQAGNNQGLLVS